MIKSSSKLKTILAIISAIILFVLAVIPSTFSFNAISVKAEDNVINVFSWEDYLDLGDEEAEDPELKISLLDKFKEETGITVNYYTFATNEEMYNEIMKDPTACDLVCPSEYMIMKMRDEELIKPYTAPQNYVKYGSPYIKGVFEDLGLNAEDGKTYAVGYMWGTMGYIYNMDLASEAIEKLSNWDSIWSEDFKGKATIKDSVRDTYIMALAVVYKDKLMALKQEMPADYNDKLTEIFNRTDDETIAKVEEALQELRPNLYGFEVDSGKSDIITGKIDVNFAWSGDAVAAIDEADAVGKKLGYIVPEEGSNIWFDGWVMTKDANEENASKFIDFICRPDNAIRNMDYIGYVSCIRGDEVFNYVVDSYGVEDGEYSVDLSYFFDDNFETNGSNPAYIVKTDEIGRSFSALYADYDTIKRCAVMRKFDNDMLVRINAMWNRVKLITLELWQIILIVVLIVLAVAGIIVYMHKDKLFPTRIPKEKKNNKKNNGYKVISKVEIR